MSEPLTHIEAPNALSRFSTALGEGFVRWLDRMAQATAVRDVEVLNIATARADSAVQAERITASREVEAARQYADASIALAVRASGVALDTDGTPMFSPGSLSPRILADTDGNPYMQF